MKVCYFGTYDVEQSRNNVIIQGLRQNGVEVLECHARLWYNTADKIRSVRGGLFNPGLLGRALGSYLRLIRRYARIGDYDVMVVGYAGHFDLFLAKLLTSFSRKPLVFDALLSLTESYPPSLPDSGPAQIRPGAVPWVHGAGDDGEKQDPALGCGRFLDHAAGPVHRHVRHVAGGGVID